MSEDLTNREKIDIMSLACENAWPGDGDVYPREKPIDLYHAMIKAITSSGEE